MYNISNDLKVALDKSFREESYIKIVYGLVDPDAPNLSTLADNGHLSYSGLNDVEVKNFEVQKTYETLELNRFLLDGKGVLKAASDTYDQGYVGNNLSNADCTFTVNPTITITFSDFVSLSGLTFSFDTIKNEYPSLFSVTTFSGATQLFTKDYAVTNSEFYIKDQLLATNKIVLEFKKTAFPYRRIRLFNLIYGLVVKLKTEDITTCSLVQTVELGAFSLPKNDFTFEILDLARAYDPENPDNLLKFLEAGQEVEFYIGHTVANGDIEWIPMSLTYTDGKSNVTDGSVCKQIKFTSGSILNRLEMVYDEWVYTPTGITMKQLATNVLTFAGLTGKFVLDNALSSVSTNIVLKGKKVKEILQLIANACNCNFIIHRDGIVRIEPFNFGTTDFNFTLMNVHDNPTLAKIPLLKNLNSKYKAVSLDAVSELASVDVSGVTNYQVIVNYDPATNITYTNTGLTVVGTPQIYSTKMVLFVTGSGTIKVSGNKLKYTDVGYSVNVNTTGSDLQISNDLISDQVACANWCTYQIGLFGKQNSYTFDQRGFPQLDCLDDVTFQNSDQVFIDGKIIENTISFNGSLSGKTKVVSN